MDFLWIMTIDLTEQGRREGWQRLISYSLFEPGFKVTDIKIHRKMLRSKS